MLPGGNASACEAKCRADTKCAAYVYEQCGPATNHCWLKAGPWKAQNYTDPAGACSLCSQVLRDLPLPAPKPKGEGGDQYWGPTNAMLSLIGYAEAERADAEVYSNVTKVVLGHFLAQKQMMIKTPLASCEYASSLLFLLSVRTFLTDCLCLTGAAARWTDMAFGVAWLLDHNIGTAAQQADLIELGSQLHDQGTDWVRF